MLDHLDPVNARKLQRIRCFGGAMSSINRNNLFASANVYSFSANGHLENMDSLSRKQEMSESLIARAESRPHVRRRRVENTQEISMARTRDLRVIFFELRTKRVVEI